MSKINPVNRFFTIRAYCTECNKLLNESVPFTRKELLAVWDDAVFKAINIPCKDCKFTFPNYKIKFTIHDSRREKDYDIRVFIPAASYSLDEILDKFK